MGCGKTSLGKPLAGLMDYKFIDLDLYIEQQCITKISDIFSQYGESYFRKIESDMLIELCECESDCIISTGGGTPCFGNNMEIMNSRGITVYINMDRGILVSRLKESKKRRPLLENMEDEQMRQFIFESLDSREPFYKKADIEVIGKNIKANDILLFINGYGKKVL